MRNRAESRAAAAAASEGVPDNAAIHLALAQRIETVGRILANCFRIVVWVIALLTILGTIGIDLTPLVAGATVVGATVGFGAQTLVRDSFQGSCFSPRTSTESATRCRPLPPSASWRRCRCG